MQYFYMIILHLFNKHIFDHQQKGPANGNVHLVQTERKSITNRKHVDSESRHFVSQTFRLRPIFGCKMGDTSSLNEEPIPLEEVKNTADYSQPSRAHSPRFINITDIQSAIRAEKIKNQEDGNDSGGEISLSGFEVEDAEEPLLTDMKLTCSDCESHKTTRKDMEMKMREMSDDIQRLERKIDTLVNSLLLSSQGSSTSSDQQSTVQVHKVKHSEV